MKRLGIHESFNKDTQVYGLVEQMIEFGSNSAAAYIGSSRSYQRNYEIDHQLVNKAKKLATDNSINLEDIIIHGPVLINLANTEKPYVYESSYEVILADLQNMKDMGLKLYNFHPGSNADSKSGMKQVSDAINMLHDATKDDETIILLETMMTKGNYIGKNFEQLGQMLNKVKDKDRIGICLDTCHIWDGGYDIVNNLEGVLSEFDNFIGLDFLKALHINDSKNALGSGKDRHENIGDGFIGVKALKELVNHPKLINLPKAMEVPKIKERDLEDLKRQRDLL